MRQLIIDNQKTLIEELKQLGVDSAAYPIFTNKVESMILKFEALSCAQVHIVKQTALTCGADAAIPKIAYRGGRGKKFPLLLFGNRRQIEKIEQRLREQPWMKPVCTELKELCGEGHAPALKIGTKKFASTSTYVMGIINVTPDSFYDGSRYTDASIIERVASEMTAEGADFIDIGAESTRPGSDPVDDKEEMRRLKHALPAVLKHTNVPVSVDTYKANTAAVALDLGASMINDISGLRFDAKMARVIAQNKASLIIMHLKGKPKTMQRNPQYKNLMQEIYDYFDEQIAFAVESGIERERIIVDPGLGFGKRTSDNYTIIRRLAEFRSLDRPIIVGHSRKSFIGKPFKLAPEQRLEGSLGVEALLIKNGATIIRVHDVLEAKRVAVLIDVIER
jgi:dihydropteroate synthase